MEEPNNDIDYFAALSGRTERLRSLLEEKDPEERRRLLEEPKATHLEGEKCTLLMVAAKNGYLDLVQMLLREFNPSLESECNVLFGGSLINGATALWIAAASGHLRIVQELVSRGAVVNHGTSTQSTPIRAACYAGNLEIVRYLVCHGADIHLPNKFNGTCLMIASYKGCANIVDFLLENKADVNVRASCGATALYFACQGGHLPIVSLLLARMDPQQILPNKLGMTPLKASAEQCRASVLEYLLDHLEVSLQEKIEAFELLGASFANDKEHYDMGKAFHYLRKALELRESESLPKENNEEPIEAYGGFRETKSLSELSAIQNDEFRSQMEGLIVRERILGRGNGDVCHPIIYRGAMLADAFMFDKCILLWLHALRIEKSNNKEGVTMDILHFAQLFCQMIRFNFTFDDGSLQEVFEACVDEIEVDAQVLRKAEPNMRTMIYLMAVLDHIKSSLAEERTFTFMKIIYRLIKIDPRTENGASLLHLAVNGKHKLDTGQWDNILHFPSAPVTEMLLKAGCDPELMDNNGNTPLHHIAQYKHHVSDFINIYNIVTSLLSRGAHIDAVNKEGRTPSFRASLPVKTILREKYKLRLKCLAARTIQKYKLPFRGSVPLDLEKFIRIHGP